MATTTGKMTDIKETDIQETVIIPERHIVSVRADIMKIDVMISFKSSISKLTET